MALTAGGHVVVVLVLVVVVFVADLLERVGRLHICMSYVGSKIYFSEAPAFAMTITLHICRGRSLCRTWGRVGSPVPKRTLGGE